MMAEKLCDILSFSVVEIGFWDMWMIQEVEGEKWEMLCRMDWWWVGEDESFVGVGYEEDW